MTSRIAAAALAVLLLVVAVLPRGAVHRCLRSGAIMPPTHSCCPTEAAEKKASPATVDPACCETVPGSVTAATETETRADDLLRGPELAAATTFVLHAPAPPVHPRTVRSPRDGGRPPPGDRLRTFGTVLRV